MIVVDASVAAKWVLDEPGSEAATALLDSSDPLCAPDLLRIEGAGAISRRLRTGRLDPEEARERIESWLELVGRGVLELVPSGALIQAAADLSVELRHPLVDCLYVALAIQRSADLVTADAVLARRAAPSWPRVRLLATDR